MTLAELTGFDADTEPALTPHDPDRIGTEVVLIAEGGPSRWALTLDGEVLPGLTFTTHAVALAVRDEVIEGTNDPSDWPMPW